MTRIPRPTRSRGDVHDAALVPRDIAPPAEPIALTSASLDRQLRRLCVFLYAVALGTTAIFANLPARTLDLDRRTINLLILPAILALGLVWRVPWQRLPRNAFLVITFATIVFITLGVRFSGGWDSPLQAFSFLAIVFNAAYYRRRLAVVLDGCVALAHLVPAFYDTRGAMLVAHLVIFVPVLLSIGFVADALTGHIKQRERQVGALVARHQEAAREFTRLAALQRAGVIITAQLDPDEAMQTVVQELSESLGYRYVGIYLLEGVHLVLHAHAGFDTPIMREAISEGVMGRAVRTRHAVLVADVCRDSEYVAVLPGIRSEICVPLLHDAAVVGVMNVESMQVLDESDLELLELFAQQTSAALHNARMHAGVTQAARTDSLTGTLNRGALDALLAQAVVQAVCTHAPLGLLFFDLDHFKRLNDRWGHQLGDAVLCAVVQTIDMHLRPGDTIGRYGGEEFLIVLPDTGATEAGMIAERLRASVAGVRLPTVWGKVPEQLTVSIGIACLPDDGGDVAALIRVADAALYDAKAAGRNRVRGGGHVARTTRQR